MMEASADAPAPNRRRRRWLTCGSFLLLLVVVVGGVLLATRGKHLGGSDVVEGCLADTADGYVPLSLDQMRDAATISAVAVSRNLPEQAVTIALATSMQESKLVNLAGGDRDSIGLFQQRPSQGWGTPEQISDPVYATDKFLDKLVQIPGYAQLPLTQAAQDVQHSAYPDAYAQHEADATTLSGALIGRVPRGMTCTVDGVGAADGTAGVKAAQAALRKDFGSLVSVSGASPDTTLAALPVPAGKAAKAAAKAAGKAAASPGAPQPRVLEVSVRGTARQQQNSWAVAEWAVANAKNLHITSVSYAGHAWTSAASADTKGDGWTAAPASDSVRITLAVAPAGSASASPAGD